MQHVNDSVYLNQPIRPRRPLVPTVNRRRSQAATAIIAVALVGLTLALAAAATLTFFIEPEPVDEIVDAAFADVEAQAALEREVAEAITDNLIGADLVAVAAIFELDVEAEAARLAPLVLDDTAVQDTIHKMAAQVHRSIITGRTATRLDLSPINDVALAVVTAESPRLAAIVPPNASLGSIEFTDLPDVSGPASRLPTIRNLGPLAAMLLLLGAAVHPRRHLVARALGQWALGIGIVSAGLAFGLPWVIASLTGYPAAEGPIRSVTLRLLGPTAMATVVGTAMLAFAAVAQRREVRMLVNAGAAAALGADEPPLWDHRPPMQDIGSRGLVDVSHPLTNI